MTNALAFFTHAVSLIFHLSFGMVYLFQPNTYLNPPRLADPCGVLSLPYLFQNQTPDFEVEFIQDTLIPLIFLKLAGIYMITLAGILYYEAFVSCKFRHSASFAMFHLYYTVICIGGFRNHWADVDTIWPLFVFHLFLALGMLKLKRVKVYDLSSEEEEEEESTDQDDSDFIPPQGNESWSVDEDYYENQEEENQDEEGKQVFYFN